MNTKANIAPILDQLKGQWRALGLPAVVPDPAQKQQMQQVWPQVGAPCLDLSLLDAWLAQQRERLNQTRNNLNARQQISQAAFGELKRLSGLNQNGLQKAQANYEQKARQLQIIELHCQQLAQQGHRLSDFLSQLRVNAAVNKDKFNQATLQAKALKERLGVVRGQVEEAGLAKDMALEELLAWQNKAAGAALELKNRALALQQAKVELSLAVGGLAHDEKMFRQGQELKTALGRAVEQGGQQISSWKLESESLNNSLDQFERSLALAGILGKRIVRLEKLLQALGVRLPQKLEALQSWQQECKNLEKTALELEDDLAQVVSAIDSAENLERHRGKLSVKLALFHARLQPARMLARELARKMPYMSQAMPLDLERGRRWTEEWRHCAKEQRALLTQALGWQQEILLKLKAVQQRAQRMHSAWQQQAYGLSICHDLGPDLYAKGLELAQAVAGGSRQEQSLSAWRVPAPLVENLVKTPLSFKSWNAAWRRLQPALHLPNDSMDSMAKVVDYWQKVLSEDFSKSIRQPLEEEKQRLANEATQTRAEKERLQESRGRTAVRLWHEREQRRLLAVEKEKAAREARQANMQLADAGAAKDALSAQLDQLRREHHRSQDKIHDLLVESAQGKAAKARVDYLEGALASLRREEEHNRDRLENLVSEKALLLSYKEKSEELAIKLEQLNQDYAEGRKHINRLLDEQEAWRDEQERNRKLISALKRMQAERANDSLRIKELENIGLDIERLQGSLALARKTIKALKAKALERHRLYRQSQGVFKELLAEQERNTALKVKQDHLAQELAYNKRELLSLREKYREAVAARDDARARLTMERSVRLALTGKAMENKLVGQEIASARDDAGRWGRMAKELNEALQAANSKSAEVRRWQAEAAYNAARAGELEEQLKNLSILLAKMSSPEAAYRQPAVAARTLISHQQTGKVLNNLQQVRKRLKEMGRSILHGWAFIALVSGSLLLATPTSSGTAIVNASRPLLLEQMSVSQIMVAAVGSQIVHPQGELVLDITPDRPLIKDLPAWLDMEAQALASELWLPVDTMKINAQSLLLSQGQSFSTAKQTDLRLMAEKALTIVKHRPRIAHDLSLDALAQADKIDIREIFHDRLYDEYRSLGFSPAEALGALASNQWAAGNLRQAWATPDSYQGRVKPIGQLEGMEIVEFVEKISPYIESRMKAYVAANNLDFKGSTQQYARQLAFDIFSASEAFAVPRTFLLAIGHQETFYANVLGDSNRSASPFQLFAPTRKLIIQTMTRQGLVAPPPGIRLERHLTMATYMAAFHLKQLMHRASHDGYVDTNRLMRHYNGSDIYGGWVAKRQQQLAGYLAAK